MGVVIVMPALAECEQGDPPAVGRKVASCESPRAPAVGGGIHQPCGMQSHDRAQEDSPHQKWETADCEQCSGNKNHWHPVIFGQPNMCLRFRQVRNVMGESGDVL